ncbi:MAG: DUF2284 domain-containing protein [Deltaproteobacteria bacterium]|nr:DUF2284 domain-containing protein [Deltaproteobacteria bacterium]
MWESEFDKYCHSTIETFGAGVKQILPDDVVTSDWVRWKCQYGCPGYGRGYSCPPHSPSPDQTRAVLNEYSRALLFHLELREEDGKNRREKSISFLEHLVTLEGEMFKDGYYKAFVFLAGPCHLCDECSSLTGAPCNFAMKARPSMEACGIDVYQTARTNGFPIEPLKQKGDPRNLFCLMLVD